MHDKFLAAANKANETNEKLAIVGYYRKTFKLALNYKLIERMDKHHLEYAYRMLRLEQKIHSASTCISSIYKGIVTRR